MASVKKKFGYHHEDVLRAKYALGETGPQESQKVDQWIAMSDSNRKLMEDLVFVLDQYKHLDITPIDEEAAWQRFQSQIEAGSATGTQKLYLYRNFRWISVAALVAVIIIVWAIIRPGNGHKYLLVSMIKAYSGRQSRTDTLPDGTVVTLYKNSSLFYPSAFSGNQRNVIMNGDAFFLVQHDARKPFRIAISGIIVTALGTSFDILSSAVATEIDVKTGVVAVSRGERSTKVYPHEKLVVPKSGRVWVKESDSLVIPKVPKTIVSKVSKAEARPMADSQAEDGFEVQRQAMGSIIRYLLKQHVVPSKSDLIWAALTDSILLVNGVKQPEALHQKLKAAYLKTPGEGFYFGPVEINGKGYFFDRKDIDQ
jgi:transmembrane sensor